jgi:hypothetical protein
VSIFRRGEPLGAAPRRYKIKVTTEDGQLLYWRKRGEVHTLEEDVADTFVAHFKPELFGVLPDGSMTAPEPGRTLRIRGVEKELV